MAVSISLCAFCKHWTADARCAAFPQGIPTAILSGLHDHRRPYAGIAYCDKDPKSIGQLIQGLVVIWELLEPDELKNRAEFL
ncbi:MAG TPA: hypothetical protein VG013_09400 [Gemmataceae bacterium]|jgi:hypothetical protein|nr:hypothetical protein [Gemmataceae bacterium]